MPCGTSGQASRRCQALFKAIARLLGKRVELEARQDAIEIFAMQLVEPDKAAPAGADLLHRWLVFGPPSLGEGWPVEVVAERAEQRLRLARDRGAPVDEGAEDIEEQCGDHVERAARSAPSQLSATFTALSFSSCPKQR